MFYSDKIFDIPLSKYTTFGIGGNADCLFYPKDESELSELLQYSNENNIPLEFIGSGSNLLVSDEGFNGIVISLRKTFKKLLIESNAHIIAQSGVMLGTMVKKASEKQISGLESLIGVPGTLGGALIMNAGAFGSEISNYFIKARAMTKQGKIKSYTKNDLIFSYRYSSFPKNEILIEAEFKYIKGNLSEIKQDRAIASESRKSSQPLKFRSAGSIFKNPTKELAAGYLIDQAGLKGTNKGGASISEKHANFIINRGNATSEDVFHLIKLIKKSVYKKFNIKLDLEIRLIGFRDKAIKELNYV